jgi:hypothetical protein
VDIVGITYPNADGSSRLFVVKTCRPGDPLELRPEPKHPLDPYALRVLNARGEQLGFVPADRAPWIGAKMRAGPVSTIFQGETRFGAMARIRIGEGDPTLPEVREPEIVQDEDAIVDPDGPTWGA